MSSKLSRYDPAQKTISDLDIDALSRCASHLSLQDISNLAMSSRYLRTVAYSDSIWLRCFRFFHFSSPVSIFKSERFELGDFYVSLLCRAQWPREVLPRPPGVRDAFLSRRKALLQFNFLDPFCAVHSTVSLPVDHLLVDETQNTIIYSQARFIPSISY